MGETKRKRQEGHVKVMQKEDYERVLDAVFCSILLLDENGILVHYNRGASRMFGSMGWDLEERLGTPFEEFTEVLREKADYLCGSGRYRVELHNRFIVCNIRPWMEEDRRIGTILILHESMQSNCIAQELDAANSLLQEVNIFVESSHDGFLVTDSKGKVIRVNAAWEKAFSADRKDVIGKNVSELIASGLYPESAALEVIKTGEVATVMIRKGEKQIIATGAPVFGEGQNLLSVVVNVRDITELNSLRSSLEQQRLMAEGYVRELAFIQSKNGAPIVAHSKGMQKVGVVATAVILSILLPKINPGKYRK